MFSMISSYISAIKYIISLVKFKEEKINEINFNDETYKGLNSEDVIVRVFYSKNKNAQSIIIFPGASPYAENHPGMIMLGNALRNAGYNVFLPRIPNLKNLLLVKENVDWFAHCYQELLTHNSINKNVMVVGLSYGGANLLKASMDQRIMNSPPKSILSYGTYYSIQSALDFFITGKIQYKNKVFNIKPHEWGTIVLFYNFFKTIDTKCDKNKIIKLLKYRIEDNDDKVDEILNELNEFDRNLINKVLKGIIDDEITNIINKMLNANLDLLEYLSPSNWADKIRSKVYVIHGANDSMVPFTESAHLANSIQDSKLLISFLYEHREISTDRGIFFKFKELIKMVSFFANYFHYNK